MPRGMDTFTMRLLWSCLLGLVASAPFFVMEGIYTGGFSRGVPVAASAVMWMLTAVFIYLAISILRVPFRDNSREWIAPLLLKICAAAPVAVVWVYHVNEQ